MKIWNIDNSENELMNGGRKQLEENMKKEYK